MKWITWSRVGIDRMACAWLIKRYIDDVCEFSFVPYGEGVDERDGIAFDIPGKRLSHHRGNCTFITMLKEYRLEDEVLNEIGKIVNGADTVSEIVVPDESSGVEAICIGLRLLRQSDERAIESSETVFDALYHYLKNGRDH